MANFNIDQNGNMWVGTNVSNTFSTAQSDANTKFYVESDGTIKAEEGSIGGVVIDANGMQSSNYDAATNTGWRIDNSQGTVFAYDIELILKSSNSSTEDDIPTDGKRKILVGSVPIYDFNGNLNIHPSSGKSIIIHNGNPFIIKGESGSAQMKFDGAGSYGDFIFDLEFVSWANAQLDNTRRYSNPTPAQEIREFYFENDNTVIFRANEQNADVEFYGDIGLPSGGKIYINGDDGTNGDVLKRTATGMEWGTASGAAHPDSDHTSFLTQSDADTRYVNESDHTHSNLVGDTAFNNHTSSATAHGTFDNYSYWRPRINGSNISGTIGSTDSLNFVSGNNMTISESGSGGTRNITFSAGGTAHTHTSVLSISVLDLNLYRDIKPSSSNSKRVGTSSTNRMLDVFSRDFHGGTFYGTLVNSSSQNTKTNIEDTGLGLDFIEALPVKQFNYITADHSDKKYTGVIAEDVTSILEENGWDDYYLVVDDSEKYSYNTRCSHPVQCDDSESFYCEDDCCSSYFKYTEEDGSVSNWLHHTVEECEEYEVDGNRHPHFNYYQLIGPLVKAVQELSTQISDLTARVEALEG